MKPGPVIALEPCLSAKEVATILGVGERSATRLMKSGQLSAFKINGGPWRTTRAKVVEYQRREFERYQMPKAA